MIAENTVININSVQPNFFCWANSQIHQKPERAHTVNHIPIETGQIPSIIKRAYIDTVKGVQITDPQNRILNHIPASEIFNPNLSIIFSPLK